MRRSLTGLCLTAALALAGCGSTAQQGGLASGAQQRGLDSLGQPIPGSGTTTDGLGAPLPGAALSGGGVPGSTTPGADGTISGPTTGPRQPGPSTAVGASRGRGVTATTISIGFPVLVGEQAAAEAFGIQGAGSASPERIAQAVVNEVNSTGGILGRKIQPVFHELDTAQAVANQDAAAARICADFRDDRPVFAVLFNIAHPAVRACTAAMRSPFLLMNNIGSIISASAYDAAGGNYLYGVNTITNERLAELFIASLESRGFHEKWNTTEGGPGVVPTKLGVIHVDTPDENSRYDAYARELAKRGRTFAETVTYPNNVQEALAATQSAVLRFKTTNVSHVYGASIAFMQAAESQGYRPRYAYLPGLGALGATNAPAVQMRGAMTVGWAPAIDVNAPQDPGESVAAKQCKALMVRAGLSTANRRDLGLMFNYCDAVLSLRDALTAGGEASVAGLRRGFDGFENRFVPALTFQATLGPRRHSGVDATRDMAYDSDCSCLVYTSRSNRT